MTSPYGVDFWNDRYNEPDGLAYGEAPNDFVAETVESLLASSLLPSNARVLCIAEGEGRNAIHLAKKGFQVFAMDFSAVGMQKLNDRAKSLNIEEKVTATVEDLSDYDFRRDSGPNGWDLIIAVFAHVPPPVRVKAHAAASQSLKTGGYFLLEAYTPQNVGRGTGGPQAPPLCMSSADLASELTGLEIVKNLEMEREVHEGKYHQGLASVVQFIGKKK